MLHGNNSNQGNMTKFFGLNDLNSMNAANESNVSNSEISRMIMTPPTTPLTPKPVPLGFAANYMGAMQENKNAKWFGTVLNKPTFLPSVVNSLQSALIPQQQQQQAERQLQLQLQQQQVEQQHRHLLQLKQQPVLVDQPVVHQQVRTLETVENQPQNEICNSLKKFAMSANKENYEIFNLREDVMQDFAANGLTIDNLHRDGHYNKYFFASYNKDFVTPADIIKVTAQNQNYNERKSLLVNSLNKFGNNRWMNKMQGKKTNKHSQVNKEHNAKRCVFCENNNEPEAVIKSHTVRDNLGRVLCPKLRVYVCPICSASGDKAHTIKYCPKKPIITMEDSINAELFRLTKSDPNKQCKYVKSP